jgi:hypothetical protein
MTDQLLPKAGRALDHQIHRRIMKDARFLDRLAPAPPEVPRYSTQLDAAWLVMVQLRDYGLWLSWQPSETRAGWFTATVTGRTTADWLAPRTQIVALHAPTIPLATCAVALVVAPLRTFVQPRRRKERE